MNSMGRLEYSLSGNTIDSSSLDGIVGLLSVELIRNLFDPLNGFLPISSLQLFGVFLAYLLELLGKERNSIQISQSLLSQPLLHILDNLIRIFGSRTQLSRANQTYSSALFNTKQERLTFTTSTQIIERLRESSPILLQSLSSSLGILPSTIVSSSVPQDLEALGLKLHGDTNVDFRPILEFDH
jgi:hypothetical protein